MSDDTPQYPGYKNPCNGCGLCCLTVPCAISDQFGLWKDGKCKALRFSAGRYWCDVINNPRRVSVRLAKISKEDRLNAIGSIGICDHRAAWSVDEGKDLLKARNAADEFFNNPDNSYPRAVIVHLKDKKLFLLQKREGSEIEEEELVV